MTRNKNLRLLRAVRAHLERAKEDPVYFAEHILRFVPFEYQKPFLQDHRRRIVCVCGRQVGKSTLGSIKALHYAFFKPNVTVIVVSASLNQSLLLFDKIARWFTENPLLRVNLRKQTRRILEFDNGSRIIALPCGRTGFTLRGFTVDMAILDEANFMPADVIDGVVKPMLVTRPNSILIMLTTPWNTDHPVYDSYSKPKLGYSRYHWPTRLNPRVDQEGLVKDYGGRQSPHFQREYEGVYSADEDSFLQRDLIMKAIDEDLEYYTETILSDGTIPELPAGEYFAGLDLGKKADYSVLAVVRRDSDALRLVFLKRFKLGTHYANVIGYVKILSQHLQYLSKILVDQTGVGEFIVEEMKQAPIPNVEGIMLTLPSKQEIMTNLKHLLSSVTDCEQCGHSHPRLMIPYRPDLIAEMNVEKYELMKTGQVMFSHPEGTHDDSLWALGLAAYAAREAPIARFKPFTRSIEFRRAWS